MTTKHAEIVVLGDVAVDCHVIRKALRPGATRRWDDRNLANYCESWGGAKLLAQMLECAASRLSGFVVTGPAGLPANPIGCQEAFARSYALWEPFGDGARKPPSSSWRVKEFQGVRQPSHPDLSSSAKIHTENPKVIVIDDAAPGENAEPCSSDVRTRVASFQSSPEAWPCCVSSSRQELNWGAKSQSRRECCRPFSR